MSFGTRYGFPVDVPQTPGSFSQVGNNTASFTNFLASVYKSEEILEPVEVLGVYSSHEMLQGGIYMKLVDIFPLQHGTLVWVDTNTPIRAYSN